MPRTYIQQKVAKRKDPQCLATPKVFSSKNRRKSAVLYSPEACEESMVHSVMESRDYDGENIQAIYKAAQVIRTSIANFTKTAKGTDAI